jgi:PIN domain
MNETVLLVDYENVQKVDLQRIPPHMQVRIFVGASQAKVPMDLVEQAQALGSRLKWVRIDGQGSNALDFHIAFHLGEALAAAPKARFVILSRDKGFDPLIKHLVARGAAVQRVSNQADAMPTAAPAPPAQDPRVRRALELLGKVDKKSRPRKRKTLTTQVASYFRNEKKLSPDEVTALVDRLFADKLISEVNQVLTYHF